MLTPELVRAKVKSEQLEVRELAKKEQPRACELAERYLELAREHVGKTRQELELAWDEVPVQPRERVLALALRKLVEDQVEFAAEPLVDPVELRSQLFLAAAAARRELGVGKAFERDAVVNAVAAERGLSAAEVEAALYADLRSAHVLRRAPTRRAEALVADYDLAQVQAVLLRAEKVRVEVRLGSPAAYRALFNKLKFRQLLFSLTRAEHGYVIDIDGPYSLFESVTKYGLQLALLLPTLADCDTVQLEATVRWGARRQRAVFRWTNQRSAGRANAGRSEAPLTDDVVALVDGFRALGSAWSVEPAEEILELPGYGTCVPDLVFERADGELRVFLEVLGYWSRDAVFRRVELVSAGLSVPILFAASHRLRVSEAVLQDEDQAGLYVYKGTMSPRAVLRHLEQIASRAQRSGGSARRGRRRKA